MYSAYKSLIFKKWGDAWNYQKKDTPSQALKQNAIDKMGYRARVIDRILKVARTIADLEGCTDINSTHSSEAIQYRTLDRK